jgi:hypothetical protein
MVIADANGLPISAEIFSASSHEVTLVEATLDGCFIDTEPEKLIGDLAYDSDPLDDVLAKRGIDLISPISRTASVRSLKMVVSSDDTFGATKSNAPTPGFKHFDVSSSGGSGKFRISAPLSISAALSFWGDTFEYLFPDAL